MVLQQLIPLPTLRALKTKYDDIIYGTEGGNSLDGRFGNNTMDGRGGFDFVEYTCSSRHNLDLNLSTGVATFTKGADGTLYTDSLVNIEGVILCQQ